MSSSPPPSASPALLLTSLLAAIAGGALLALLHVPLAWMIGAMFGTAALGWHRPVAVHPATRPAALIVLGLALGSAFTGPVLAAVVGALPLILLAGVLTIASGLLVARLFMRLAGTDARTGYFCSVPGGVIVMAVLAQREGVPVATVTLAQTMRVLLVVLSFPLLLGTFAPHGHVTEFSAPRVALWWPGLGALLLAGTGMAFALRRTGIANPWMLGPCSLAILLGALGKLPSGIPILLVNAAQVGMGLTLGTRLTRNFLLSSRRLAIASLLSTLALCLLLTLLGLALAWIGELPWPGVLLGVAPGGMPEMALTAAALELAVPLVLGFHLTRTVLCNLLVGPLFRLGQKLRLV